MSLERAPLFRDRSRLEPGNLNLLGPGGIQTSMLARTPPGPADSLVSGPDVYFKDKTLRPGRGHDWGAHDHAVLTLVVRGRLDESFSRREQRCPGWEMHYKPRGAIHATSAGPEGVRMLLLGLRGQALEGLTPEGDDRPRLLGSGVRVALALSAFLRIERARRERCPVDRETVRGLWAHCGPRAADGAVGGRRPPSWLTEVRHRIVSGEGAPARLSRLAAEFRVHPVYLARAFRKSYGRSIGDARRRARADRAVIRLAQEDTPLSEVSLDLGYADQSHFTREFRRVTGWTPGRFRQRVRALSHPSTS